MTPRRTIAEHTDAALALAHTCTQRVSLADATGLTLASDTTAQFAVPPFDNSAMDGFAVHAGDIAKLPATLPVAGDIPAGANPVDCPPGHAVRIMTGAPVPPGGDIVVIPVEQTNMPRGPVDLPAHVTVHTADAARSHVRRAGSNVTVGGVVSKRGTRLDAGALAAQVATGVTEVEAFARPRVAVISTGDELVGWPGEIAGGQIPNSNLPMIASIARDAGADVTEYHADDRSGPFSEVLDAAAHEHDLVITSGGISAGAFDVVRAATAGEKMWFGSVAQRPGGPQGLGIRGTTPLLCLPGNPVATFVSAHLYAVPLIRACAGQTRGLRPSDRPRVSVTGDELPQPNKPVTLVVPVSLDYSGPEPTALALTQESPGSDKVASLSNCDGLALVPHEAWGRVDVLLI